MVKNDINRLTSLTKDKMFNSEVNSEVLSTIASLNEEIAKQHPDYNYIMRQKKLLNNIITRERLYTYDVVQIIDKNTGRTYFKLDKNNLRLKKNFSKDYYQLYDSYIKTYVKLDKGEGIIKTNQELIDKLNTSGGKIQNRLGKVYKPSTNENIINPEYVDPQLLKDITEKPKPGVVEKVINEKQPKRNIPTFELSDNNVQTQILNSLDNVNKSKEDAGIINNIKGYISNWFNKSSFTMNEDYDPYIQESSKYLNM